MLILCQQNHDFQLQMQH